MAFTENVQGDFQWSTGDNTSGIFFDEDAAGVDHSTDAAPYISVSDGVADGSAVVSSATANFTAGDDIDGNGAYISGDNTQFIIQSHTSTTITLDRNVTAGSGLDINVGGTGAIPTDAMMALMVKDTGMHLKKDGDYTLSSILVASTDGTNRQYMRFKGYNTTHDDCPSGTDRPTIACGSYYLAFIGRNFCEYSDLIISSSNTLYALNVGQNARVKNMKFELNNAGIDGIFSSFYLNVTECEFSGVAATGVYGSAYGSVDRCYFHDFTTPDSEGFFTASSGNAITNCIFDTVKNGVSSNGHAFKVIGNTFYNVDYGVRASTSTPTEGSTITHNIFDNCIVAMGNNGAKNQNVWNDWNNFTNNGDDTLNWTFTTLGLNSTFNAVNFVDAPGGDFTPDMASLIGVTGTNAQGAVDKAAGGNGGPNSRVRIS